MTVTPVARVLLAVDTFAAIGIVARDGEPAWILGRVALVLVLSRLVLRSPGWVWVIVGTLAAAAGGAIAVPHAAKSGVTGMTIAGGLVLVTSLALAAIHGVALVRPLRWGRRLAAIPMAYAVLQLGVLPVVGAVAATNVPPTALGTSAPDQLGPTCEEVTVRSADGVELSAWYVPPTSASGATIVLLHGSGSTRRDVLDHAGVLVEAGYGALLLDARGHGRSGGDAMDFGWFGERDVRATIDWLHDRPDVDAHRIALLGLSMGGEQAITAAAADDRIAAVVAEGVTARVAADTAFLGRGVRAIARRTVERIMFATADVLTSASPPASLRASVRSIAPRPVLLITGSAADEREAGEWLRTAAPTSVSVWASGAGHTDALAELRTEWRSRVLPWLERALGADA